MGSAASGRSPTGNHHAANAARGALRRSAALATSSAASRPHAKSASALTTRVGPNAWDTDRLTGASCPTRVFFTMAAKVIIATRGSPCAAGSVAATRGLARLIGEREFSVLFHEGSREHLHVSLICENAILLILFDGKTTLGLVRLRVRRLSPELEPIFEEIHARSEALQGAVLGSTGDLAGITDDEIDALLR